MKENVNLTFQENIIFADYAHQSQSRHVSQNQPHIPHMQDEILNTSEWVEKSLGHKQDRDYQDQRNSTILDSRNVIPPFNPETSLSDEGH